jgi:3-oxoacyl-[acyl-carrier-protein] synthase-3
MGVYIKAIEYHLPEKIITNDDLQLAHPGWDVTKVAEKSGVLSRHVAGSTETAFDLACQAVEKLFNKGEIKKEAIQGILFCTQSPDYIMPSNSFLIHKHFGFNESVWSFDFNLACSGYIYGLSIARGMIETNMAENILLINADTYSKYIHPEDRSTKVLFGDGAAASIIAKEQNRGIIDLVLASSGKDYEAFYIPNGGNRHPKVSDSKELYSDNGEICIPPENIQMNGFAIWKFVSRVVPKQISELLQKNNIDIGSIAFFGFHQASKMTLDALTKALKIDPNKVFINLTNVGNTVSASIPIVLKDAELCGKLKRGDLVLLSGFGVGLSYGSLIMIY